MKIVADPNIPFVEEAFGPLGDVRLVLGRQIDAAAVHEADLLLVRSITAVNAALLGDSSVKFVATATIGTDHVDAAYLRERGIGFASAAGCNANSVAEYVVSAMLELAHRNKFRVRGKTLGVVGVGNVGSRVIRYAEALGLRVLQNDPPRERAENLRDFVSLDGICAEADVITLHVPLTKTGPDATYHLFDEGRLATLEKRRPILFNTSRGAVVSNPALLKAIGRKSISSTVLDVWEKEPNIAVELLDVVDIGTPHIAGYSFDGKVIGTGMIYRAACQFFNLKADWEPKLPPPPVPRVETAVENSEDDEEALRRVIRQVYNITVDNAALHHTVRSSDGIGAGFDKLRAEYPVRREFFNTELILRGGSDELRRKFAALGFKVVHQPS